MRRFPISAADGLAALQIALAALESAQQGIPINLEVFTGGVRMKIGMMSFAHLHAEAYIHNLRAIPGVEMIGIADEDSARGQHFAELFDARLYPSYEAMLAEQPDGVLVLFGERKTPASRGNGCRSRSVRPQ